MVDDTRSLDCNETREDGGRFTRRSYLRAAGAAGVAGLAGCTGAFGGGGSGPIKIGTAFPYTGPYGPSANRQRDGVELAVKEMNENGGLLGRDVETVDRDTELNPDTNAQRIRNLLYEEEVDLLIANLSGGITTQTQSLAKEAGVPYMSGSRTSPPFHFPSSLGQASYAAGQLNIQSIVLPIKAAFEEGLGDSFFSVMADYGFNRPAAWNQAKQYINGRGGSVEGSVLTPLGNKDFSSAITDAMDSGADVLLAMVYGVDFATFIQQAREFNVKDEMVILNPVQSVAWLQIPGDMAVWEDVYLGMSWHPSIRFEPFNDSQAEEFASKFQDEFDYPGEDFAGITYTGAKELERAVSESGGLSPEDVAGVLDGSTFSDYTMDGESMWRACDNQIVTPSSFVFQGKKAENMGERGKWDVVNPVVQYDPSEFLPECSYFEELEQQRS